MRCESTYCCRKRSTRARRSAENPFVPRLLADARGIWAESVAGRVTPSMTATSSGRTRQEAEVLRDSRESEFIVGSTSGVDVLVCLVVLGEQITAEVVAKVAPHRVDVVGVGLLVVVFHEHRRTMDAVIVRLADLGAARPGEAQLTEATVLDVAHHVRSRGGRHAARVVVEQPAQLRAL